MYGTVARMKVKRENLDALRAWAREAEARGVPGYVNAHVLLPDDWNDEVIVAVMFEDKDSYVKNADSPEQHESYLQMRALLEADPEWTDGEWLSGSGAPGSTGSR
jgi:antibiotic biosynthesis monooxygenase (ABM) superfamily enzyme